MLTLRCSQASVNLRKMWICFSLSQLLVEIDRLLLTRKVAEVALGICRRAYGYASLLCSTCFAWMIFPQV